MSVCPSFRPLVGPLVRWSVTLLLFGLLGATNAVYTALFEIEFLFCQGKKLERLSQIIPRLYQLAQRPTMVARRPTQLAQRPSQLDQRPSQLALRPSQLAPSILRHSTSKAL